MLVASRESERFLIRRDAWRGQDRGALTRQSQHSSQARNHRRAFMHVA
jgi:hypothetical protein